MLHRWLPIRSRRAPFAQPSRRLRLEALEDRRLMAVTVTGATITGVVEGTAGTFTAGTFTDTNPALTASQFNVVVNYGDGTTPVTNASSPPTGTTFDANLKVTGATGNFTITDTHTFPEEAGSTVPPFFFPTTVTVTENTLGGTSGQDTSGQAQVTDAPLAPGNPVPVGPGQVFVGGNTGNATTAAKAFANFKTAVGGADNSTATGPLTSGFRTINWDGVKVDGTDFGGGANTTVINKGHTVGIPLDRFQTRGVYFGAVYAVSNDGFSDVNASVGGANPLFPAFSPSNTFAMFNDNGIDFKFVVPSPSNSTVVSAASRGFGAIFLNVQQPGTVIQYFHGNTLIDTVNVPVNGTAGAAEFAGELFNNPIVTNVQLFLGQGVIFKFDGTTITSGGTNSATNNLVATDDFVYAEPVAIANGFPIVSGPAGTINAAATVTALPNTAFTGTAGTFSDSDPNANAADFTATINWGDGHLTNGTIKANSKGGFDVSGTNTYLNPGIYNVNVDVQDFGGSLLSVNNTALVGTANNRLVTQMYLDLLQRQPDGPGLAFWTAKLDGGQSAQSVAQGIESSPEFQKIEVQDLFQHYLHRAADSNGLTFFTAQLASGGTLESVASQIVNSPEYLNNRGGGTSNGALAAIFQDALGRPIDATGQTFFSARITAGETLGQVATDIFNSPEFAQHITDVLFQDFLRRHADSNAFTFFGTVLSSGNGDVIDNAIAIILGSPEYNNKVQAAPLALTPVPFDPLTASLP